MPLLDITSELAADFGLSLSNPQDAAYLLDKVNKTAKMVYDSQDLQGCQREALFELGTTDQQVCMPWYVDKPLLARNYDTYLPIKMLDFRPRYQAVQWVPPYLTWRIKQKQALKRNIGDNITPLTLTFAEALAEDVTVKLAMETANASSVTEAVFFAAGETTKTTNASPINVLSITKTSPTNANLSVTDEDGNEVAEIANHRSESLYTLMQVMDRNQQLSQTMLVEILFKLAYSPYVNDNDIFTAGIDYERAIYYETKSQILLKLDNRLGDAKIAHDFYKGLASSFSVVQKNEVDPMIVVSPNPYLGIFPANLPSYGGLRLQRQIGGPGPFPYLFFP